jgi:hypothetical protein
MNNIPYAGEHEFTLWILSLDPGGIRERSREEGWPTILLNPCHF